MYLIRYFQGVKLLDYQVKPLVVKAGNLQRDRLLFKFIEVT